MVVAARVRARGVAVESAACARVRQGARRRVGPGAAQGPGRGPGPGRATRHRERGQVDSRLGQGQGPADLLRGVGALAAVDACRGVLAQALCAAAVEDQAERLQSSESVARRHHRHRRKQRVSLRAVVRGVKARTARRRPLHRNGSSDGASASKNGFARGEVGT